MAEFEWCRFLLPSNTHLFGRDCRNKLASNSFHQKYFNLGIWAAESTADLVEFFIGYSNIKFSRFWPSIVVWTFYLQNWAKNCLTAIEFGFGFHFAQFMPFIGWSLRNRLFSMEFILLGFSIHSKAIWMIQREKLELEIFAQLICPFLIKFLNNMEGFHDTFIAISSPITYSFFAIALWIETRSIGRMISNNSDSRNQWEILTRVQKMVKVGELIELNIFLQTFLQVFIISLINTLTGSLYVIMQRISASQWLITLGQFAWLHIHGGGGIMMN